MANYVLVYKGGGVAPIEERRQVTQARHVGRWRAWFDALGADLVDGGQPFGASSAVASDGTVTGGASSGLTGYTILQAESLEAATEKARGCPVLADGGSIEIYEALAFR